MSTTALPSEPAVRDLSQLKPLDREKLTLFVCGPGQGEAVLVALPEKGWLVIDGAGVGADYPHHLVLDRYRDKDDPIDGLLLTHPHQDHYRGFIELLDNEKHGEAVVRVGCLSLHFADLGKTSAELAVWALEQAVDPANSLDHLSGGARGVVERIRDEWEEDRSRWLPLVAGQGIPLTSSVASARVLAPDRALAADFFLTENLKQRIKNRANDVSGVVEIAFETMRLVLGGDLPDRVGSSVVPTGWREVCQTYGPQRAHDALKVPHHGSLEALADCLVTADSSRDRRTWVVSPFNTCRLPSFAADEGVDELLKHEAEVHLTAMPRAWNAQSPLPARTSRSTVSSAGIPATLGKLGPGTLVGNPPKLVVEDCVWALVFDPDGRLVERYRGPASTLVER